MKIGPIIHSNEAETVVSFLINLHFSISNFQFSIPLYAG